MAAGYGVSEPDAVKEGKREVWGRETRTRQGKIESGKKGISKIGPGGKEREMVGREGWREEQEGWQGRGGVLEDGEASNMGFEDEGMIEGNL